MTDPGTADRTYIGPMTPELVEEILEKASLRVCSRAHRRLEPFEGMWELNVSVCRRNQMQFFQLWVDKQR